MSERETRQYHNLILAQNLIQCHNTHSKSQLYDQYKSHLIHYKMEVQKTFSRSASVFLRWFMVYVCVAVTG